MSILKIYSVRDNKSCGYHAPFTTAHEVTAIRSLRTAVNTSDLELSKYPEDFELYQLGEMCNVSGQLKAFTAPVFIISAMSLINTPTQNENATINEAAKLQDKTYHGQ